MQRNPQFNNPLYNEAVTEDENEMGKNLNNRVDKTRLAIK